MDAFQTHPPIQQFDSWKGPFQICLGLSSQFETTAGPQTTFPEAHLWPSQGVHQTRPSRHWKSWKHCDTSRVLCRFFPHPKGWKSQKSQTDERKWKLSMDTPVLVPPSSAKYHGFSEEWTNDKSHLALPTEKTCPPYSGSWEKIACRTLHSVLYFLL